VQAAPLAPAAVDHGERHGSVAVRCEVPRRLELRLGREHGDRGDDRRCGAASYAPPLRMRIFSGIQPTGRKHLGNYIGAIRQYVEGQDRGEAIYCIVDMHAITVPYDPAELRERVLDTTAILVAAGLDPERCILFRQGDVVEHTELCWLLTSVTSVGELQRMHQFRDKSFAQRELVSAGILFYPVLQAADVLVYRADEVPVGEDQREHLELMRDVARRFNSRFGETFVVPEHRIPEVGARIMDLQDPTTKMSTTNASVEGTVYVLDEPSAIEKKIKRAVTDSGTDIVRAPDKPGVTNLIDITAVARGIAPDAVVEEMRSARGYGDLKAAAAQAVVEMLTPVRERYEELRADETALQDILAAGADKARVIAADTIADVREAMGFGAPQ
jgi:tryptophanyl-tRNA synthetase